jgi:hypothetical protein
MREIYRLSAPEAWQRADAIDRIAAWKGDIGADLRVAYKIVDVNERAGMFLAARARADNALLTQAAAALSDKDVRLTGSAETYLLSLPVEDMRLDTDELSADQRHAWDEFLAFRMRRDVARMLVDAYVKPGKFFGQFDELRRHDAPGLDRELLALITASETFRDPLRMAAEQRIEEGIEPTRMFSPSWRLLVEGLPALRAALSYYAHGKLTDAIERELGAISGARLNAALTVMNDLRATAARALTHSEGAHQHTATLLAIYRDVDEFEAPPALRNATDTEGLKTEIEVALAQAGEPELLNARIEALRVHIQRTRQAADNLNLRAATRPDLMAQNQIAQLLLRAGDYEGAEKEWTSAIQEAILQMRENNGRSRSVLVSYLGAAMYNLACAQSLQLKLSRGLASLKAAVEYGYKDFAWMLEDGDLAHLRRKAEFEEWFRRVAPPSIVDRLSGDDTGGTD